MWRRSQSSRSWSLGRPDGSCCGAPGAGAEGATDSGAGTAEGGAGAGTGGFADAGVAGATTFLPISGRCSTCGRISKANASASATAPPTKIVSTVATADNFLRLPRSPGSARDSRRPPASSSATAL
jgi:hypothetical protein